MDPAYPLEETGVLTGVGNSGNCCCWGCGIIASWKKEKKKTFQKQEKTLLQFTIPKGSYPAKILVKKSKKWKVPVLVRCTASVAASWPVVSRVSGGERDRTLRREGWGTCWSRAVGTAPRV